jgi:hypothetical protein
VSLTLVAVIAIVWAFVGVFALALCRAASRRAPVPPARPRVRVRQSRENVGTVEFIPTHWDD